MRSKLEERVLRINVTNYNYIGSNPVLWISREKSRFTSQSLLIIFSVIFYVERELKFSGLDTLPARSRNVVPTLLSSSFNQRATSGRWAHLSPVLFNFRRVLCPISSNSSLTQSSTWRLVSPLFGPPVRTSMLVRPLLYTVLLDEEIQLRRNALFKSNLNLIVILIFYKFTIYFT